MEAARQELAVVLVLLVFIVAAEALHFDDDGMPHGSFFEWAGVVAALVLAGYGDHVVARGYGGSTLF